MSKPVGLDTNIFIYHFDRNTNFHKQASAILAKIIKTNTTIATSTLTLMELLSYKNSSTALKEQFLATPNLMLCDLTVEVALKASEIRKEYGFGLADSVQLATAQLAKAGSFITNDTQLKKFRGLKVTLLQKS